MTGEKANEETLNKEVHVAAGGKLKLPMLQDTVFDFVLGGTKDEYFIKAAARNLPALSEILQGQIDEKLPLPDAQLTRLEAAITHSSNGATTFALDGLLLGHSADPDYQSLLGNFINNLPASEFQVIFGCRFQQDKDSTSLTLSECHFGVQIKLEPIDINGTRLRLKNAQFLISLSQGQWQTSIAAQIELGDIAINIYADYTSDADVSSLSFTGTIETRKPVNIKVLLNNIPFINDIPEELVQINIISGTINFKHGKSNSLNLQLTMQSHLKVQSLFELQSSNIQLSYDSSGQQWALSFKGSLQITLLNEFLDNQPEQNKLSGELKFLFQQEKIAIRYIADRDASQIIIPTLCPGGEHFTEKDKNNAPVFVSIGMGIEKFSVEKNAGIWGCHSITKLSLYNVASPLNRLLSTDKPENGHYANKQDFPECDFYIAKEQLSVTIGSDIEPLLSIEIPDFLKEINDSLPDGIDQNFHLPELGEGKIELGSLGFSLKKDDLSLSINFAIGLPANLNGLIGLHDRPLILTYGNYYKLKENDTKEPYSQLNGYRYDKKEDLIAAIKKIMGVGYKNTVQLIEEDHGLVRGVIKISNHEVSGNLLNFPIRIENFLKGIHEKDNSLDLDLREMFAFNGESESAVDYGKISIEKPKFSLDTTKGSFKASGGYSIDPKRKLMIPFFPLRKLLELLKLYEFARILPPGIPVQSIKFFDSSGNLQIKELRKFLAALKIELPQQLWAVIDEIAKNANYLPDRFKDYLSINIPEALSFAIDISGDGSVSFDLEVKETGDPLQLLIPQPPFFQFTGIRLYRLSFGTAFANSLLKLEINAEIDSFDLPTLAGSILFPHITNQTIATYLPESARLQNSFIVKDLVVLIVYETGVPIPIPLFYEKLEIAYFGITDFEVRNVISCPMPSIDPVELLKIFSNLIKIFTRPYRKKDKDGNVVIDEGALLSLDYPRKPLGEEPVPDKSNMDLIFSAGPLYLRLPKFLGYNDTDYYEVSAANYPSPSEKPPLDDQPDRDFSKVISQNYAEKLQVLIRKRYLTEAGFKQAVGDKVPEFDVIKPLCKYNRPMGQLIGTVNNLQISALDLLSLAVNSVKKESINYPVQYFDINDRIGDFKLSLFNVFNIYVTWALTTPNEFNGVCLSTGESVYQKLVDEYDRLAKDNQWPIAAKQSPSDELLRLIAENDTGERIVENTEGAIIFMRGGMLITNAVIFETAFGLMIEAARGFRTGVSFYGYVAKIVDVKLLGFIKISPKSDTETFKLLGKSSLKVFDREVAAGLFELTNDQLLINAMLDLFPEQFPIALKGHIIAEISKQRFLLDSGIVFELGALKALARIYMHAEDNVPAALVHYIKDEFHVAVENNIDVLFIRLSFINSELDFSLLGKNDHAAGASIDVSLYMTALRLITITGNLNITVNQQSGLSMQGQSRLIISSLDKPLITGEAFLLANLDPANGFMGIQGNVSLNCYFLSSKVSLTGGLAIFSWFSGDKAGDFLLSIGGYHPLFKRPAHYPVVSKVGLNFQLDRYLSIKGNAYFALTASCIMAGGRLEASWQSGGIKAAFVADANFITAWKPFSYHANVSVSMRLSYTFRVIVTHTLACELGASVTLWGPELSGRALIHVWRLSIPINFGGAKYQKPKAIGWQKFRQDFLPEKKNSDGSNEELLKIAAVDGVLKDLSRQDQYEIDWVINPNHLKLTISSVIPVKEVSCASIETIKESQFGIAPMDIDHKNFRSIQAIRISCNTNAAAQDDFIVEPVYQNSLRALWGESIAPDMNNSPMIKDCITGFEIRPKHSPDVGATIEIPIDNLRVRGKPLKDAFAWESLSPDTELAEDDDSARKEIMQNLSSTVTIRQALVKSIAPEWDTSLENMSRSTETAFMRAPQIWKHTN